MDLALAVAAVLISGGFLADLIQSRAHRPRLHASVWAIAMATYLLATLALAIGLAVGWSSVSFRAFYWLGAIVNIPLLAAGSVALLFGRAAAWRFLSSVVGFSVAALVVTAVAPLRSDLETVGIPEGSEVFAFTSDVFGVTMPGPRLFAALAGSVGTMVIVGLALYSVVRHLRDRPRVAAGNLLIVAGTSVPAFGGSLTALGEDAAFAGSLAIGAALLWAGYRVASGQRRGAPLSGGLETNA